MNNKIIYIEVTFLVIKLVSVPLRIIKLIIIDIEVHYTHVRSKVTTISFHNPKFKFSHDKKRSRFHNPSSSHDKKRHHNRFIPASHHIS